MKYPESLSAELIAPCGMDCGACSRHLRAKDSCDGCRSEASVKPKYCAVCRIRNCETLGAGGADFCFECEKFPCARLRQLDKRYRTRYGMSMIENLGAIRDRGLASFIASEKERWRCPACGALIRVHKDACIHCGHARDETGKTTIAAASGTSNTTHPTRDRGLQGGP